MLIQTSKYALAYVLFFWGVAWRTLLLSLVTAIFSSIGIGVLAAIEQWPPETINEFASLIGLPITLAVAIYVFSKQSIRFTRRQKLTA